MSSNKQLYILIIACICFTNAAAQSYDKQYAACSEALRKLTKIDSVYFAMLQKRDSCLAGVPAPDFTATTIDNERIELSKLRGKVVVLNFWFTRCQPCISEIPGLNKLVELYAGKKVTFISITYDSTETVMRFLKQHPFKFKIVANNDTVRRYIFKLFSAWPYTIIINKEGKIADMQSISKGRDTFVYFNEQIKKLL